MTGLVSTTTAGETGVWMHAVIVAVRNPTLPCIARLWDLWCFGESWFGRAAVELDGLLRSMLTLQPQKGLTTTGC